MNTIALLLGFFLSFTAVFSFSSFGYNRLHSRVLSESVRRGKYLSAANKGGYVPEGLTPEQYKAILDTEAAKTQANKKRFFQGKEVESLTEWMENNEKKGLKGLELNRKGHRMVKAKYDGWYTNQSPV